MEIPKIIGLKPNQGMLELKRKTEGFSENNCLLQVCSVCDGAIELDEGDVIFGNEWYHRDCWEVVEGTNLDS